MPINWGYWTIFLYVAYENPALPTVTTSVWINDRDLMGSYLYNYFGLNPMDNSNPIGFSLYSDRTSRSDSVVMEGYNNFVNSNYIGTIGGFDSLTNGGVKGLFYYQNNVLFGLDDDTPDSLMSGSDGLADIRSYINYRDTTFNFLFDHEQFPNNAQQRTNFNLAEILAYTTPCDTFSTSITPNDTICLGQSLQLNATGGVQYSWYSPFGGLNDTSIANPLASPTQTTNYICTITNDSGCVKTEHVKIWVNPVPVPDTILVTNNTCGDSVRVIAVGTINGNGPFSYNLTNLTTLNSSTQASATFSNLGTANYELVITNINGCTYTDTLTVAEVINVNANFVATPEFGVVPLDVMLSNASSNANQYNWTILNSNGDSMNTSVNTNHQYLFDSTGTFTVCLLITIYRNVQIPIAKPLWLKTN